MFKDTEENRLKIYLAAVQGYAAASQMQIVNGLNTEEIASFARSVVLNTKFSADGSK